MPFDIITYDVFCDLCLNGIMIHNVGKRDYITNWIEHEFFRISFCPFCKTNLHIADKYEEDPDEQKIYVTAHAVVGECSKCGYWQAYFYQELGGSGPYGCPGAEWEAHISKLSEFPDKIPEGCYQELAQYLKINPSFWHTINPTKLEKLVADIFRANHRDCEVIHVGKPNDGGVDVVFVDSGKNRWMIQVKRRELAKKAEGVSTLRNLLGALLLENSKHGIVVSTSDHFSFWAQKAKNQALTTGYTIELVDKGKLKRLIDPLLPNRKWIDLIKNKKPEWLKDLAPGMPDRRQMTIMDFIRQ